MRLNSKTLRHLLVCLGTLAVAATGGAPLRAEMTIEDIIENVRRNEALYDNIDVTLLTEHHIDDRHTPVNFDNGASEVVSMSSRTKFVGQGGLFRLDQTGKSIAGDKGFSEDRISAFDGKITRIYDQNAIGNLVDRKKEDPNRIRPHMLLFRTPSLVRCALSTFLSGEGARSDELAWLSDDLTRKVTYQGELKVKGLRCHVVWITCVEKPEGDTGRWELWLAEDRNYLPVRRLDFRSIISKDLPEGEGEVDDLREIEPGVWFPFAARATGYNAWAVQTKGVQQLEWEERFITDEVSLHPNYPPEYFADVPFPDGTAVYEIKGDEIARSYVNGAPGAASSAPVQGARWWLLIANVVIAVAAATFVVSRSRQGRQKRRKLVNPLLREKEESNVS